MDLIFMNISNYQKSRSTNGGTFCLEVLFFFNILPRHTNLFDECASRYVHLPLQEEECTSSFLGDSKMYTSGSIVNSQMMLTEINWSGGIAKIRIWVVSNTVKHLKAFYYELKIFFQIFVSKVCWSVVAKNSLWTLDINFINKFQIY